MIYHLKDDSARTKTKQKSYLHQIKPALVREKNTPVLFGDKNLDWLVYDGENVLYRVELT